MRRNLSYGVVFCKKRLTIVLKGPWLHKIPPMEVWRFGRLPSYRQFGPWGFWPRILLRIRDVSKKDAHHNFMQIPDLDVDIHPVWAWSCNCFYHISFQSHPPFSITSKLISLQNYAQKIDFILKFLILVPIPKLLVPNHKGLRVVPDLDLSKFGAILQCWRWTH